MDHSEAFFIYSKLYEAYQDFLQQGQYLISMCSYTFEDEDWHEFTMHMNELPVCAFIKIMVITLENNLGVYIFSEVYVTLLRYL